MSIENREHAAVGSHRRFVEMMEESDVGKPSPEFCNYVGKQLLPLVFQLDLELRGKHGFDVAERVEKQRFRRLGSGVDDRPRTKATQWLLPGHCGYRLSTRNSCSTT